MAFEWKSDIEPDDPTLIEKNVDFVWDEAKERMASTVESYDILVNKAHMLLGFVVTLTSALIAYLVATAAPLTQLVVYCGCSAVSTFFLLRLLWSKQIHVSGYMPDRLFQKEFMSLDPKAIKSWLIRRYGEKIAWNVEITHGMGRDLKIATVAYLLGVAVLLGWLIAACL